MIAAQHLRGSQTLLVVEWCRNTQWNHPLTPRQLNHAAVLDDGDSALFTGIAKFINYTHGPDHTEYPEKPNVYIQEWGDTMTGVTEVLTIESICDIRQGCELLLWDGS